MVLDFAYIICQKNINTRIMLQKGSSFENPLPGTIIDHSVTRKMFYDFFLVPQTVRQGTVTPTHFIVLEDTANMPPDIMQRLTYKLCFLYYNWPGRIDCLFQKLSSWVFINTQLVTFILFFRHHPSSSSMSVRSQVGSVGRLPRQASNSRHTR